MHIQSPILPPMATIDSSEVSDMLHWYSLPCTCQCRTIGDSNDIIKNNIRHLNVSCLCIDTTTFCFLIPFPDNFSFIRCISCYLLRQRPTMFAMVNHLPGHATVNADVLARDETSLVRAEKEHHIGYIQWIANSSYRLLGGI